MNPHLESFIELNSIRISSPTCEDLGIPFDPEEDHYSLTCRNVMIKNPSLHLDGLKYEVSHFPPMCMIPLPDSLGIEPNFIRRRNERERDRVRCVNEGYERLKEHLPLENKEKRISKVETLRSAIQYIKHLQAMLADDDCDDEYIIRDETATKTRKRKFQKESLKETDIFQKSQRLHDFNNTESDSDNC